MQLKGSKTHGNLKAAFAGESQANRRYLYFAAKAEVEGQNDVTAEFLSNTQGQTGHARRHSAVATHPADVTENDRTRGKSRSADAPSCRVARAGVLRGSEASRRNGAGVRHLSRMPALRQPVHGVSDALRSRGRERDARS